MAQIKIQAHVYAVQFSWEDSPTFQVYCSDSMETCNNNNTTYTHVGPVSIDYTMPAGWNQTAAQIAVQEQRKADALAAYQATVADANERLAKLQAIGCEVAA